MKEATVSWSKADQQWIIRFWSESSQEWEVDSSYFVKDVDPDSGIGWVSELLVTRLYDLQDLGYTIRFN